MFRSRIALLSGLMMVSLFVASACSDDDDAGAEAFAADYCQMVVSCCDAAGLGSDPSTCEEVILWSLTGVSIDQAAADACLAGMRSVPRDEAYCSNVMGVAACSALFRGPSGNVQPGGSCDYTSDCAGSPEGYGDCVHGSSGESVCMIVAMGTQGASPCVGNKTGAVTVMMIPESPPQVGYVCDEADSIYCDFDSRACIAMKQIGEPCDYDVRCVNEAWCDQYGEGTCVRRASVGEACEGGASEECAEGAYCNDFVCAKRLPAGAPCKTGECQGNCVDGVCEPLFDVGLAMLCGAS